MSPEPHMTQDNRIPATLLTGFLGSGKTTLLNHLLRHPAMQDTAVIINEIGEAGLDHILARTAEDSYVADNTVLLGSGCLCCTLRSELADTLRDLYAKRLAGAIPPFSRLVIETTGLADPGPIMANLLGDRVIGDQYRLDAVVVTVDATHGRSQLARHGEARKQAAVADILLITKTDLASDDQIGPLTAILQEINPGATIHPIRHGRIEPACVIDVGLFGQGGRQVMPQRWLRAPEPSRARRGRLPQGVHEDGITSFTVTIPKPLTWKELEPALQWICATFDGKLLRLKGIVHAEDFPAPLAVHAVQRTLYKPVLLSGWDEDEPLTRIVLIGQDLDEMRVREALMQV